MIDTLKKIKKRYEEIEALLAEESVIHNLKRYTALSKEHKGLSQIVSAIIGYEKNEKACAENRSFLQTEKDEALLALAKEEREELAQEAEKIVKNLKMLLLPKDPNDDKNIILELRAGAGGDEAALWARDLFRMYQRFTEAKKWKLEVLSFTESSSGGYKEIICHITGDHVYSVMKYESGVHRVQRVPSTETQGRLHTSAASVVVLLEADEVEVEVDMSEVKKETFCASGPGGQSVNTTYSAVRLTHIPTSITVSCQDGKSQIKNLEKALKVLRARLYERALKIQQDKVGKERKAMVGTGDRSAKIRTYNFPRAWVNDHRVSYVEKNLFRMLNGDLDTLIEALQLADNAAKLQQEALKIKNTQTDPEGSIKPLSIVHQGV